MLGKLLPSQMQILCHQYTYHEVLLQDLLTWLEDSDMQSGAMPAGSPKPLGLPGLLGVAPKHQEAAEVHILALKHQPAINLSSCSWVQMDLLRPVGLTSCTISLPHCKCRVCHVNPLHIPVL